MRGRSHFTVKSSTSCVCYRRDCGVRRSLLGCRRCRRRRVVRGEPRRAHAVRGGADVTPRRATAWTALTGPPSTDSRR